MLPSTRAAAPFGSIVSCLAGLLVLVGLIVPVDGTLAAVPPGIAAAPDRDRCVVLTPVTAGAAASHRIRLTVRRVRPWPPWSAPANAAGDAVGDGTMWRPAGRDSIDIAQHHRPIIRLPLGLAREPRILRGRAGFLRHTSFYAALTDFGAAPIVAREVACD